MATPSPFGSDAPLSTATYSGAPGMRPQPAAPPTYSGGPPGMRPPQQQQPPAQYQQPLVPPGMRPQPQVVYPYYTVPSQTQPVVFRPPVPPQQLTQTQQRPMYVPSQQTYGGPQLVTVTQQTTSPATLTAIPPPSSPTSTTTVTAVPPPYGYHSYGGPAPQQRPPAYGSWSAPPGLTPPGIVSGLAPPPGISFEEERRRAEWERWQEQQRFLRALDDAAAGRPQSMIVPVDQQRRRTFEGDQFAVDQRRFLSEQPPGVVSISDLQLIPLRRDSQPSTTTVVQQQQQQADIPVGITTSSAPASVIAQSTKPQLLLQRGQVVGVAVGRAGNLQPFQFAPQDAPRSLLSQRQDDYLASVASMYQLSIGIVDVPTTLIQTCRPFNVDEDSIAVAESMLECLLLWLNETGKSHIRPLFYTFPLQEAWMSLPLRMVIFGETGRREGQSLSLEGFVSPFSWRHSPKRQLNHEPVDAETLKLRGDYHRFLANFYTVIWRIYMKRQLETSSGLPNAEYNRFLDSVERDLEPYLMTVRVLETRIMAIAGLLQLVFNEFFNTGRWLEDTVRYRTVIDPKIGLLIATYAILAL